MYKRIKYFLLEPFYFLYYKIAYYLKRENTVFLYWFNLGQNFGDSVNPLFISALSSKKIFSVVPRFASIPYVCAIGSIIEHTDNNSIIWGSGFISSGSALKEMPKKVLAVRGPKSRERFLDYGVECPEIYGDPALLLPKVYNPKIQKKYKYGFVPHHSDFDNLWLQKNVLHNSEYLIIDLQKNDMLEVIDDILSCERIVSSSLHGMITADAYGIPSVWIQFSDKVLGQGFKFIDYFESVGRKDRSPLLIQGDTSISEIEALFYDYKIQIDLEKLLKAAPFPINICELKR